jgi:hypothetical protein
VQAPEAKRLQRCLSAVLNFAKYREDMVLQWQELRESSRDSAARIAALKEAQAAKARATQQPRAPAMRPRARRARAERLRVLCRRAPPSAPPRRA